MAKRRFAGLNLLKRMLLQHRRNLAARSERLQEDLGALGSQIRYGDDVDKTFAEHYSGVLAGAVEVLGYQEHQLNQALQAVMERVYGRCEECYEEIPIERLRVLPHATRCMGCQKEYERELDKGVREEKQVI